MQKISNILYESLQSTSRMPSWWILAFFESVCLFTLGGMHRHFNWRYFSYAFLAWVILQPLLAFMWINMQAFHEKKVYEITKLNFFYKLLTTFLLSGLAIGITLYLHFFTKNWVFLVVVSSIVYATVTLAILNILLCNQNFFNGIKLAFSAWQNKISLIAWITFILILSNTFSFSLVRILRPYFIHMREFSVLFHSATIWILLVILSLFIGFCAALLNYFLIVLFLETIRPVKDAEAVKSVLPGIATQHNN